MVVAQLVRALDCGSRGRRFETGLPPNKKNLLDFSRRFFLFWGIFLKISNIEDVNLNKKLGNFVFNSSVCQINSRGTLVN